MGSPVEISEVAFNGMACIQVTYPQNVIKLAFFDHGVVAKKSTRSPRTVGLRNSEC